MEQIFTINNSPDFLKLKILKYAYPEAADEYDSNWLDAKVKIKAGAFSGEYRAYFQTSDFLFLKEKLTFLYHKLDGSFTFTTLEQQLQMNFVGDGLGHISIDCKAQDDAGNGNIFEFELCIDQTEIKNLFIQLDEIIKTFPVR
jgi:hypothetical protein